MLRRESPVWEKVRALDRLAQLRGRWLATAGRDPQTDVEQDRRWIVALATAERELHEALEDETHLAVVRAAQAARILKPADLHA
jgi:hypothetical protein